jgi:nicotinamidase-related amidase
MEALIIIDMQAGSFTEASRYDAENVINRINKLHKVIHKNGGIVIFIQHNGSEDSQYMPGKEGWELISSLVRDENDFIIHKYSCDAFYETELSDILNRKKVQRLIITGCATDFCVDTTIRAAASRDYEVIVMEDGHTTADRPYINAETVIKHHNWLWQNYIHPKRQIQVIPAGKLINRKE